VRKRNFALAGLAAAAIGLSLLNASWLAPAPSGELALIAHRGTAQTYRDGAGCDAERMNPRVHTYIENTIFAMQGAVAYGARGFLLDVRPSADGHAMIFRDAALDCRTDGSGRVAERTLDYLKSLDVGYGYTSDGGATFPLRGRGVGAMATAVEAIRAFPDKILIFTLHEPAAADAIVAAFREAGSEIGDRHGFAGPPETLARLRQLSQAGWLVDPAASEACLAGYRRTGWLGLVPGRCRGTTLLLSRDGGWTLWGWPYRFLDRMAGAGARPFIVGEGEGGALAGLDRPEQLGEVPRHYRGLLLVEDMWHVGQALR
jgi:glycerophosphoryl diester phosphodiesterase